MCKKALDSLHTKHNNITNSDTLTIQNAMLKTAIILISMLHDEASVKDAIGIAKDCLNQIDGGIYEDDTTVS
jgi:hypothetical protein